MSVAPTSLREQPIRIYADFNDGAADGSLPLTCAGSRASIEALSEALHEGQRVTLSDGELIVDATVHRHQDGGWEAHLSWADIRDDGAKQQRGNSLAAGGLQRHGDAAGDQPSGEARPGASLDSRRRFQLWEYHVSHGTALVRSPQAQDEPCNLDIMFFGVEYLAVPRFMDGVQLGRGVAADRRQVEQQFGQEVDPEQVWVLCSAGIRHFVVAGAVRVRETTMGLFESPFDEEENPA